MKNRRVEDQLRATRFRAGDGGAPYWLRGNYRRSSITVVGSPSGQLNTMESRKSKRVMKGHEALPCRLPVLCSLRCPARDNRFIVHDRSGQASLENLGYALRATTTSTCARRMQPGNGWLFADLTALPTTKCNFVCLAYISSCFCLCPYLRLPRVSAWAPNSTAPEDPPPLAPWSVVAVGESPRLSAAGVYRCVHPAEDCSPPAPEL